MGWIKSHKLVIILFGVIIILLVYNSGPVYNSSPKTTSPPSGTKSTSTRPQVLNSAPAEDSFGQSLPEQNMVVKESTISMLVSDVISVESKIISYAKESGGYMVNTSYSKQEDSPFATISVRVPTEQLDQSLIFIRSLGVKVTDENIVGTDVTQDYTDIAARLNTLKQAEKKLQELLTKASDAEDILTAQTDLLDIQQQMDDLNGQKQALEQNARLTKITVYISTDELALPYAPEHAFRPDVIFKSAVRSMLSTLQFLGELFIWLVVYSPLIAIGVVIYRLIKKFKNRKKTPAA